MPTFEGGNRHRRHISRRRFSRPIGAGVALVIIAALAATLLLQGASPAPLRPFGAAQVQVILRRFVAAYSARDVRALGRLLAPEVIRITPTGTEHGASRVLGNYRRQFATRPLPRSYRLGTPVISGGWLGRAAGTYTLALANGSTLRGHVTFVIQRVAGHALIGLIATQQDTGSSAAGL